MVKKILRKYFKLATEMYLIPLIMRMERMNAIMVSMSSISLSNAKFHWDPCTTLYFHRFLTFFLFPVFIDELLKHAWSLPDQ